MPTTLQHMERRAAALLADIRLLRGVVERGDEPPAVLLNQIRLEAAGIQTATYRVKREGQ